MRVCCNARLSKLLVRNLSPLLTAYEIPYRGNPYFAIREFVSIELFLKNRPLLEPLLQLILQSLSLALWENAR